MQIGQTCPKNFFALEEICMENTKSQNTSWLKAQWDKFLAWVTVNGTRRRRVWLFAGLGVVVVLLILAIMLNPQAQAAGQDAEMEYVTASIGDLTGATSASGQVLPQQEASLSINVAGIVEEVYVEVGDNVREGDPLLRLDTTELANAADSAEQALIIQEANLAMLVATPTPEDLAAAEAAVASAQTQLWSLTQGPDEAELASAEANLASAQSSQYSAQINYDNLVDIDCRQDPRTFEWVCPGLGTHEEQARQSLEIANQELEAAQAELDAVVNGTLDDSAQIASARATLADAEAALVSLQDGATEEEIAIYEAEVEQARLALEDAQNALDDATLRAPFDGIVTAIYIAEGEYASGVVSDLVNTDTLEIVLDVDEIDIGNVAVGQSANVTLEAWPDEELESEVVSIAPEATEDESSAIVTYEVHLSLPDTDLPIRVGMTANANLTTVDLHDVLLIPNRAINHDRASGTYTVNLVTPDGIEQVEVGIGMRDSENTQILSGIEEGDVLAVGDLSPQEEFNPPGPMSERPEGSGLLGGGGG
jgi:HlyD family secretion protein